jgi:GT2 family glycosyltransferase
MNNDYLARVTAVMVTYHSKKLLENIKKTLAVFNNIVVVDNSADVSKSVTRDLPRDFPLGIFINNKINSGFGGGNNVGISKVATEYALIINPDLNITSEAVAEMIKTADIYPNSVVVGARIYDSRVNSDHASYSYGWRYPETGNHSGIIPIGDVSAFWLSGCCLLIRVKDFIEIGGFDKQFFMYYEEYDICQRVINAGKDCILSANALVVHESQSSSVPSMRVEYIKTLHWNKSKQTFHKKYGLKRKTALGCLLRVPLYVFAGIVHLITFNPMRATRAFAKAHAHTSI